MQFLKSDVYSVHRGCIFGFLVKKVLSWLDSIFFVWSIACFSSTHACVALEIIHWPCCICYTGATQVFSYATTTKWTTTLLVHAFIISKKRERKRIRTLTCKKRLCVVILPTNRTRAPRLEHLLRVSRSYVSISVGKNLQMIGVAPSDCLSWVSKISLLISVYEFCVKLFGSIGEVKVQYNTIPVCKTVGILLSLF